MKEEAIKFLREKGILPEDKTQFIITFEDKSTVDVVDLLIEFASTGPMVSISDITE